MAARRVVRIVKGMDTSDGGGVRMRRTIGGPDVDHIDPFLLLDEFKSDDRDDYIAGFPDHPHRGFETVTYMLAGAMRHRDSRGNEGHLVAGSVQWMTAGRGLVHSEMPQQEDGLMWGFQLWVNLPAAQKMTAPRYQDIPPERVPEVGLAPGVRARVVAGEAGGAAGPVSGVATQPTYLDLRLEPGASLRHPLEPGHNAFAYVYEGEARLGDEATAVPRGSLAVLDAEGEGAVARAGDGGTKLLLVAGRPIGEPVARYGPFVMNTRAEILQAVEDFRAGRLA
jgi:redox-sensitive bicupin YhaK (pirin superfamily)